MEKDTNDKSSSKKKADESHPLMGQLYYDVVYYYVDELKTETMLIGSADLEDFYRGKLDFLIGIADDGQHFSVNGAMIYTIKQVFS